MPDAAAAAARPRQLGSLAEGKSTLPAPCWCAAPENHFFVSVGESPVIPAGDAALHKHTNLVGTPFSCKFQAASWPSLP